MSETPLHYLSLTELGARYRRSELSPTDVTRALLERIERLEPTLHSYATVLADGALDDARRAEEEFARGEDRGPLHGVPVGVKDLCATKGVRTAAGTTVMADRVPDFDALVVERLRAAGAVIVGKLQLTEGAYAAHHPAITPPSNPWDPTRWTGISSSGSGVATASGLCYGSLGSDTGGSIRFPSACCGLVGVKPTYGRVPLHGVFPLAASLDHVGPMTRTVRDAAALLQVLAGPDPRDPVALQAPVPDYAAGIEEAIRGVRIGVDESYNTEGVAPEVSAGVSAGVDVLKAAGAEVVALRIPPLQDVLRVWPLVCAADAAVAHRETFPARAEAYGPAFRAVLEAGARVSGTDYAQAQEHARVFAGRLGECFETVDLIACPSFFAPAPPLALMDLANAGDEVSELLRFTGPYDFSGNPTISLPAGFSEDGLPLSLQLIGRHLEEELLLRAGLVFESATPFHERHPEV